MEFGGNVVSHCARTGCWVFILQLITEAAGIRISGHLSFLHTTTAIPNTHRSLSPLGKLYSLRMNSSAPSHTLEEKKKHKRGRKQHTMVKNHILEPDGKDEIQSLSTQLYGPGQVPLSCLSCLFSRVGVIVAHTSLGGCSNSATLCLAHGNCLMNISHS